MTATEYVDSPDPDLDETPTADELPGGSRFAAAYAELEAIADAATQTKWRNSTQEWRDGKATDLLVGRRRAEAEARRAGFPTMAAYIAATEDRDPITPQRKPLAVVRPDAQDRPVVWTVSQLAALPSAEEEAIIGDGILTRGGKLLLYAKSGAGKTTLLDFIAGPLATGRPFLARYAIDEPRAVLVVQGELSVPEMASHAQQIVAAGYTDDRLMFTRMVGLRLPAGEDTLRAMIATCGARIVALDPWYRLFAGESSNASEQVDGVFGVCDRLLDDDLVDAVIVVHHANVTGLRTAGSWVFEGWPSTIIRLETVAGVPAQRILTFEKVRAPSSSILGERLTIALDDDGYRPVVDSERPIEAGPMLAVLVVREAGGQLHRKELIDRLMVRAHCKERAAAKYLGRAVQAHVLRSVKDGAQAVYQSVEVAP